MKVKLITITPNVETQIVEIARVSSQRKDKKAKSDRLINYLIKNKHWSPFEHGFMTIEIQTSRAIGTQLIRHRSFTFQEFSQRYAKVTEIEQIDIRKQHKINRQSSTESFDPYLTSFNNKKASIVIKEFLKNSFELYNNLLKANVAKECARMILPMATLTTIYMTGSIRSWIHFFAIRDDQHAQKEIRDIAKAIKNIFIIQLPIISKALGYE